VRIGLRLLLAFFLILGLSVVTVLRVFDDEVEPGTRVAMEDSLVDTAYALARLAAPDVIAGVIADGGFSQALEGLSTASPKADIHGLTKQQVDLRVTVTDADGIVRFDSRGQGVGADHSRWNDVYRTLRGQYGARSSPDGSDDPRGTVMHVAAPILDGDRIVGVLTVARPNRALEPYVERSQARVMRWSWWALGVSLAMGLLTSWWLVSSLSRLRRYAMAVARGERAELPRLGRLSGNTEFADLAQALERMRVELENKDYVERYVHALTHELKSPLAAIRGASELLQEPLPDAERIRFAYNVQSQTTRLQQLIERLLALAEVEQMRRLSDVEDVDLTALTRDLLHTLEPRLRQKNLQVVDQQTLGTMLQGNRFLLSQSLRNLLDNAIDFSPDGGTLMITSTLQAGRIQWQLRDAGPGIPDYAIGRIFERFYSLPRGEGQERSSGLGLCLVREVCDLHGGTIEVVNVGGAQHDASGCEAQLKLPAQQHRR
jgi:two-component system sensor histidine kinase CreC